MLKQAMVFGAVCTEVVSEFHSSNPVIGNFIYFQLYLNCLEKSKVKKKGAGNGLKNCLDKLKMLACLIYLYVLCNIAELS